VEKVKIRRSSKKKSIFILTPTLKGGSIESILTYLPEKSINKYKIYIISADTKDAAESIKKEYKFTYLFNLPINNLYRRYIVLFELIPILKVLYFPILFIWQLFVLIKYIRNGSIIIYNGFTNSILTIFLLPLFRYYNVKTIVSYHGFPILRSRLEINIIKFISRLVNYIIVNSIFTAYIFRKLYKIQCYYLYHKFNMKLLEIPCKTINNSKNFVLVYPGPRIDYEKSVLPFLSFAIRNCNSSFFEFIFLGYDNLNIMDRLTRLCKNIKYLGFINDYDKYIQTLSLADVCWSNSEITYLTRPAIECLLLGKPVIIPDKPAVLGLENFRPIRTYLPDYIYIISHDGSITNPNLIYNTLQQILKTSPSCFQIKNNIRLYLKSHYEFNSKLLKFIIN
jgi:glycosyltransferase involved in cell wall biosynthesis